MKISVDVSEKNKRKLASYVIFAVSGAGFSLGFIFESCWFFSWLAFVPLAVNIFSSNKTSKRVFGSLFCFFFLFYVCCYSWLVSLYPLDFAGLDNVQSVLVILTGLTLVPIIHSAEMSLAIWLLCKLTNCIKSDVVKSFGISFGYVLGEFLQGVGPLGFPWARMYVSQVGILENLQSAKIFGSYFVTFAIIFVNCMIALAIISRENTKKFAMTAALIFSLNFIFGVITVKVTENSYDDKNAFNAVVLQGNIGSYEKWSSLEASYERYLSLAQQAGDYCIEKDIVPDVAVIPETAFPVTALIVKDGEITQYGNACYVSRELAKTMDCPIVSGVFVEEDDNEYNSLVCVDENGLVMGMYHKQKLVPFGEFVPYRKIVTTFLPFLSDINMLSSDLSVGEIREPMSVKEIKVAGLVCFDSVFENAVREQIKNGGQVIAVSTNDSWYRQSKALDQHAAHSIMRAIENHRPVIRSANTGISMLIQPTGKVTQSSKVDTAEFLVGKVYKQTALTPCTVIGDITLFSGFLFAICFLILNLYKKIRRKA